MLKGEAWGQVHMSTAVTWVIHEDELVDYWHNLYMVGKARLRWFVDSYFQHYYESWQDEQLIDL